MAGSTRTKSFSVGEHYANDEIHMALSVGNTGGVRPCLESGDRLRRLVLTTSVPSARQLKENPYHDRIEGDVLVYTGAGREGDQTLGGVNKRIPQQLTDGFPIYGFILIGSRRDTNLGPKRWRFMGLLQYLRHYPETQIDSRGNTRQTWVFEFRVHSEPSVVPVLHDRELALKIATSIPAKEMEEDREIATAAPETVGSVPDPLIIEGMRRRLLAVAPERFEHIIRDLLLRSGFDRVAVTRFTQDGGIDVNAIASPAMWCIQDLLLQVQAKRWLHTVGRKEVAELRGSLDPFARGAVVTTSHFSRAATAEAIAPGKNPIVLIDGYRLASLTTALGLDVG